MSISQLNKEIILSGGHICIGLDPIYEMFPVELTSGLELNEYTIFNFLKKVVDITYSYAACFKIQKAFFDQYPFGHQLIINIVSYIHYTYTSKVVFIDCKVGDVQHSMQAYTNNIFNIIGADGIVINPYMGEEVLEIVKNYPAKLFIILVRTSNPGAGLFQDVILKNDQSLWQYILQHLVVLNKTYQNIIPVLSFENIGQSKGIRSLIPDDMIIFWAGFGAQGKSLQDFKGLLDSHSTGVLVNSSRGILYTRKNDEAWEDAILNRTIEMQVQINALKNDD